MGVCATATPITGAVADALAGALRRLHRARQLAHRHRGPRCPWASACWPPPGSTRAGFTLTFRDLTQDALGRRWTLLAVVAGAALSALLSPALALASGAAFLVSELADLAVYTPLRRRGLLGAVAASNAVGLVVDSALFLALAGFPLALLPGLVLGKVWATLLALLLLGLRRSGADAVLYLSGAIRPELPGRWGWATC